MVIQLEQTDPVLESIGRMQGILAAVPIRYLLTNGKIEKQLKYFLAAAWESGNTETRATATDKRPFNGLELDVIAFDNAIPRFWAELKCTFSKDNSDVIKSSSKAVHQAIARQTGIRARDFDCPGYIVHFLTSLPAADDPRLPAYILDLYHNLRDQTAFSSDQLELRYEALLGPVYDSSARTTVWADPQVQPAVPTVFAVVIKLGKRAAEAPRLNSPN